MEQNEHPRKRPRLEEPSHPDTELQQNGDTTMKDSNSHSGEDLTAQQAAERAKEEKAGITAFASPGTEGFTGLLKTRYTDFLVNEISPLGQVLHLANLELPPKIQQHRDKNATEKPAGSGEDGARGDIVATAAVATENDGASKEDDQALEDITSEDRDALQSIFNEHATESMIELDQKVQANPNKKARGFSYFISDPIEDKQKRTEAHQLVRRVFSSRLETSTEEDNTIKFTASPPNKKPSLWTRNNPEGGRAKGKLAWEELGGEFVHFTMYKENKDTMEVVSYLCTQFKVKPNQTFQFAGTKDRRAATAQRISAFRIQAQRLAGLNKTLRSARLGDFKYEQHGLELGDLKGNEFTIVLRDCHFTGEQGLDQEARLGLANSAVGSAVSPFNENGFINYYGLQRFGTFETGTHEIGMMLLQGDYKGAVEKILTYTAAALKAYNENNASLRISSDECNRAGALHIWEKGSDAEQVIKLMPRKFSAESNIIKWLGTRDKKTRKLFRRSDFQGALSSISRNLRLMYVHAYQSLVWNVAASKRRELHGSKVVEGDLVRVIGKRKDDAAMQDVDDQGEVIVRPAQHDSATDTENAFERARSLTKEEAESGKYSIFDVVLPQPGFDVEYPTNEIGQFYKDFMGSERGGGLDPHNMRRSWKETSLSGAYRKLMAKPIGEVGFEVKLYGRDEEQLVETDLDRLVKDGKLAEEAFRGPKRVMEAVETDPVPPDSVPPDSVPPDSVPTEQVLAEQKIAVILKMQLESSRYATMALREMTKGGATAYKPDFA